MITVKKSPFGFGWGVYEQDGFCIGYKTTPKEAKIMARYWYLYLTAPTEELANKYLNYLNQWV